MKILKKCLIVESQEISLSHILKQFQKLNPKLSIIIDEPILKDIVKKSLLILIDLESLIEGTVFEPASPTTPLSVDNQFFTAT